MKKILLLFIIMAACSGCNAKTEKIQTRANAIIKDGTSKVYNRFETESELDVKAFEGGTETNKERAEKISQELTKLDGIKKASVIISGHNALVGIELEEGLELNDSSLIKYKKSVEERVKKLDGEINQVAVTAADQLIKKITGIDDTNKSETEKPKLNPEAEDTLELLTPVV